MNPADLPTRGLTASQLSTSKVWMEGPEFLKRDESCWPEKLPNHGAKTELVDREQKKEQTHHAIQNDGAAKKQMLIDPSTFSSLTALLRITAWIERSRKQLQTPERIKEDKPNISSQTK